MKQFLVALLLPALALSHSAPRYGHAHGHTYAPKCHTHYDWVAEQKCTTAYDTVCQTTSVKKFRTESEKSCSTTNVPECSLVNKSVAQEKCTSTTVSECKTSTKKIPTQECETKVTAVCTKVSRSVPEEKCSTSTEQVCSDVQDCRNEHQCQDSEHCTQVQQCTDTTQCTDEVSTVVDTISQEQCHDVVTEKCSTVHKTVTHHTDNHVINHQVGAGVFGNHVVNVHGSAIAPGIISQFGAAPVFAAGATPLVSGATPIGAGFFAGPLTPVASLAPVAPVAAIAPAAPVSAPSCTAVTERKCHQ